MADTVRTIKLRTNATKAKKTKIPKVKPKNKKANQRLTVVDKTKAPTDIEAPGPLENADWEAFCRECIIAPNPCEAYHRIHPEITRQSAGVMSCRLLKKVNVLARIAELMNQAADETIMTKREALQLETKVARGDMSDYVVSNEDGVQFVNFDKESKNTPSVKKLTLRRVTREIKNGKEVEAEITSDFTTIELNDASKARKQLGDWLGWNAPQKIENNITGELTVGQLIKDASEQPRTIPVKEKEKE